MTNKKLERKDRKQKNIECPISNVEVEYSVYLYLLSAFGFELSAVFAFACSL